MMREKGHDAREKGHAKTGMGKRSCDQNCSTRQLLKEACFSIQGHRRVLKSGTAIGRQWRSSSAFGTSWEEHERGSPPLVRGG